MLFRSLWGTGKEATAELLQEVLTEEESTWSIEEARIRFSEKVTGTGQFGEYEKWFFARQRQTNVMLAAQRRVRFEYVPLFSIIVPLANLRCPLGQLRHFWPVNSSAKTCFSVCVCVMSISEGLSSGLSGVTLVGAGKRV